MTESTRVQPPVYQPSGRFGWRLPAGVVAAGLPLMAVWSWAYANVLAFDPPWYFSALVLLLYAAFCAVTTSVVITAGHTRSKATATVVAFVLAAGALWFRWLLTVRIASGADTALDFAVSAPWTQATTLWALAENRAAASAFSVAGLCLAWLAEAAFVVWLCASLARDESQKPYSEICRKWADKEDGGELYPETRHASTLEALLGRDGVEPLIEMPRADQLQATTLASEWRTLKISGYKVEADPRARWLSIEVVDHVRSPEGKVKSRSTPLLAFWHVDAHDYARVMDRFDNTTEPATSPSERPTPPELQPAVAALETGNAAVAVSLALAHRQHPNPMVKADALRVCALGHSRLAHWPDAFDAFHTLFELEPTAHNALELAATSVMAGELLRSQAWFERAEQINEQSREIPSPQLRTRMLSALDQAGEPAACLPHLEWLANAYRAVSITDSTFLYIRGLPFFSEFLERSLPILRECMPDGEVDRWYRAMRDGLDADGRSALDEHIRTLAPQAP